MLNAATVVRMKPMLIEFFVQALETTCMFEANIALASSTVQLAPMAAIAVIRRSTYWPDKAEKKK
jgi:hypothetical protein